MRLKVWEHRPGRWKYEIQGRPPWSSYAFSKEVATIIGAEEIKRLNQGAPDNIRARREGEARRSAAEWIEVEVPDAD